jgi:PAS domain S-box-containing protein
VSAEPRSDQARSIRLALTQNDAAWRILVDDNPQPVLVFDPTSFALLAANDAAATLYAYPPAELAALPITALAAPESADAWSWAMQRAVAGRWPHGPYNHRRKDGRALQVEAVVHELPTEGDGARVAIVSDVSERATLQGQLRQAQKMGALGQLTSSIAHDFNNLLTAILTSTELAEALLEPAHPARADLEVIVRAGRRATELTRQLLTVSRKRPPKAEVLDLNLLIAGPVQLLRRLVGAQIDLRLAPADGIWPIRADAGQVEQVLLNLVVNARDAMPRGGTLAISTENRVIGEPPLNHPGLPAGEYALLSVRDTGVGMDEATLARVFEPFFTTKPPGEGTGLGLSTVYGIVKQWGGYVYGESTAGEGTAFSVLLPRA